jgi:hypothetical protein
LFSAKDALRYLLREQESLIYSIFNVKHCKETKKKDFFGSKFLVSCQHIPINLRFKKAQQLRVSNAFPAQDFI